MTWLDLISLGWRNLTSRKSRSLLTIGGVGVGIMAIILLVSIGYGLQALAVRETLQSKSLNFLDIRLGTGAVQKLDQSVTTKIKGFNDVKNIYPQLETPAKLTLPQSSTKADVIALINDTTYVKQSDLRLKAGRLFADDQAEVVVSTALLKLLSISSNNALQTKITFLPLIREELRIQTNATQEATFTVVGIVEDDETPFLSSPIKPVADIIGEFAFSAALVEVASPESIESIRIQVKDLGLETEYIGDIIAQLNGIFTIIRSVLAGFGLIATFVAALGMFNTLSVSLMERTREIGIMKTLGTKRMDVWKLFLIEGMLISVSGGLVGILLGLGVGEGLNGLFNIIARATNHDTVDFYYSPPLFLLMIFALVIVLGAFVGLIPARRATRISPLEALRYE